jgi:hypothetical protein
MATSSRWHDPPSASDARGGDRDERHANWLEVFFEIEIG